jgi:hypothetical protein
MSIISIPYSKESKYVRLAIFRCIQKKKFHIEDFEEVINIEDFFLEMFEIADEERKNRQGVNSD